jgi:hypothetical protein
MNENIVDMSIVIDKDDLPGPRWNYYYMSEGDIFWKEYLLENNKDILFILGLGFDPRMCIAYEKIVRYNGNGVIDCLVINFSEGEGSPSQKYSHLVKINEVKLNKLIPINSKRINKYVEMLSEDNIRIGSRQSLNTIQSFSEILKYNDIIVDISALPRGIYFPLIGSLLYLIDNNKTNDKKINLHVIVSENVEIDKKIIDLGIDEFANYIPGYSSSLESTTHEDKPKIWIPILGENQEEQLVRIRNKVNPDEICPMIPISSVDPLRGDKLLISYRNFLFDRLLIDPTNLLYASEQNPFQVYRVLYRTIKHYKQTLKPLKGCQIAISASSSKLLSIGALLCAYELKNFGIGVVNVETLGYQIIDEKNLFLEIPNTKFFTLWIAGDCYE